MKKTSNVPPSNPIPIGELFIKQTFVRKLKQMGLSETEALNRFQNLFKSGEIQVYEEKTENLFERSVEIYFLKGLQDQK